MRGKRLVAISLGGCLKVAFLHGKHNFLLIYLHEWIFIQKQLILGDYK